jgi:hypothetical protein
MIESGRKAGFWDSELVGSGMGDATTREKRRNKLENIAVFKMLIIDGQLRGEMN